MASVDSSMRSAVPASLRWGLVGAVVGLLLLSGCSGFSSREKPLPDSTFTHVLTELHLAKVRQTLDAPTPPGLRDSIFARHEVTPSAFDATLRYYSRRPEAFESVYRTVIDTLQALQRPTVSRSPIDSIAEQPRRRPSQDPEK